MVEASVFRIHPLGCEKVVGLGKDGKQIGKWGLFSSWFVSIFVGNSA